MTYLLVAYQSKYRESQSGASLSLINPTNIMFWQKTKRFDPAKLGNACKLLSTAMRANLGSDAPSDSLIRFHLALHLGATFLVETPLAGDLSLASEILYNVMYKERGTILIENYLANDIQRNQLKNVILNPSFDTLERNRATNCGEIDLGLLFMIMLPYRKDFIKSTEPRSNDYVTNMMTAIQNLICCITDPMTTIMSSDPNISTQWQMLSINVGEEFHQFVQVMSAQLEFALNERLR